MAFLGAARYASVGWEGVVPNSQVSTILVESLVKCLVQLYKHSIHFVYITCRKQIIIIKRVIVAYLWSVWFGI